MARACATIRTAAGTRSARGLAVEAAGAGGVAGLQRHPRQHRDGAQEQADGERERLGGQADVPQRAGEPGEDVEQRVRARGGRDDGGRAARGRRGRRRPRRRSPTRAPTTGRRRSSAAVTSAGTRPRVVRCHGTRATSWASRATPRNDQRGDRAADGDDGDREHRQDRELEAGRRAVETVVPGWYRPSGPAHGGRIGPLTRRHLHQRAVVARPPRPGRRRTPPTPSSTTSTRSARSAASRSCVTTTTCWSRSASSASTTPPPPQVEQRRRLVAHEDRGLGGEHRRPARAAAAGRPDRACTGTSARSASPNRASAARAATSRSAGVSGRRRRDSATSSTRRRHDELRVGVGEHEPDPAAHRGPVPRGVEPVHADGAGRRQDEAVEQPGERRLARAVGADDRDPALGELAGSPARAAGRRGRRRRPGRGCRR